MESGASMESLSTCTRHMEIYWNMWEKMISHAKNSTNKHQVVNIVAGALNAAYRSRGMVSI